MARQRMIKPEFWVSEQLLSVSRDARLFFIGLWNFCDDGGIHPLIERTLKVKIFPGEDDISSTTIRRFIDDLSTNGLLELFESSGKSYIRVTGWKHQRIEKPRYLYPQGPSSSDNFKAKNDNSTTDRRLIDDSSTQEDKIREEKRSEEEEKRKDTPPKPPEGGSECLEDLSFQNSSFPPATVPEVFNDQLENIEPVESLDALDGENPFEHVKNAWNVFAEINGLAKVQIMTPARKKGVKARFSQAGFEPEEIFRQISESTFLLGQNNNGWRVDFDFVFCSPQNWVKIMEGKYKKAKNHTGNLSPEEFLNALN